MQGQDPDESNPTTKKKEIQIMDKSQAFLILTAIVIIVAFLIFWTNLPQYVTGIITNYTNTLIFNYTHENITNYDAFYDNMDDYDLAYDYAIIFWSNRGDYDLAHENATVFWDNISNYDLAYNNATIFWNNMSNYDNAYLWSYIFNANQTNYDFAYDFAQIGDIYVNTEGDNMTGPLTVGGMITTRELNVTSGDLIVNNSDLFVDVSSGYVGMGTDSPTTALHIKSAPPGTIGSHPAGQLIIQSPTDSVFSNVVITAYESNGSGNPDQQLWYLGSSSVGNSDITFLNRRNAKLHLGTNGNTRMTIDSGATGGSVGIGTTSPGAKLEVVGDVWVFDSAGDPRILVGDSGSQGQWGGLDWDSTSDYLQIMHSSYSGSDGVINILSSGKVGIGTTSPTHELNVVGSANITENITVGTQLINYGTTYVDLRVSVTSTKLGGSKDPNFAQFKDDGAGSQGVFTYLFDKSLEEELYLTTQLTHSYKQNSSIEIHVHWSPLTTSTLGVGWGIECTWANETDTFGDTVIYRMMNNASGTAYDHQTTSFGDLVGTASGTSALILCRVFRDATNDTDSYNGDVALHEIDFHYLVDGLGSDGLNSKSW